MYAANGYTDSVPICLLLLFLLFMLMTLVRGYLRGGREMIRCGWWVTSISQ